MAVWSILNEIWKSKMEIPDTVFNLKEEQTVEGQSVVSTEASASAVPITPVAGRERINSVDVIRGIAVLGILLMNIASFALPFRAYHDPSVAGGATGANLAVWAINYVLFEGKMRAIFSMLFGAGMVIFISRGERRGAGMLVSDIYHRRLLWLLAFGMLHAYLIWDGDILYCYALTGLILYGFRPLAPKWLLLAGVLALATMIPPDIAGALHIRDLQKKAAAADLAAKSGQKLTEEQLEAQKKWAEKRDELKPPQKVIDKEIAEHRGGYWKLLPSRARVAYLFETDLMFRFFGDVAGMMLIGMALFKLGFLSAERSYREYALVALIGYAVGLPGTIVVTWQKIASGFEPSRVMLLDTSYDVLRLAMVLGHVAVVMMVCKSGALRWLTSRLAAAGQMAFTNYLTTSIICTLVFNGYGLGLFGKLDRAQIYYVVLGVWTLQLAWSKPWLRHFHFGPFEWAWRSLTYWKRQPMRIAGNAT